MANENKLADFLSDVPSQRMSIIYDNKPENAVHLGNELTPTQVKNKPAISYEASEDSLYTLAFVDLDVPSGKPDGSKIEILHFLVTNIPGKHIEKGKVLAEYIGSLPPKGSGVHRYVYLLYKQASKIESTMNIGTNTIAPRKQFSIKKWAKDNNLGQPIAVNYYVAQFDENVPKMREALHVIA